MITKLPLFSQFSTIADMGSLVPVSHWLPRDDLLLKQGIEDGASLESLARGAKRFSRRFTLQELQNRWYSLLYDPVVSEEASLHMFQLDPYASTAQSKSQKEGKHLPGKRKTESVRKRYYAMRKRICNDPFDLMDMDLLDGTGYCDPGDRHESCSANCLTGDPFSNFLDDPKPVLGRNCQPFPEFHSTEAVCTGAGASAAAFRGEICTGDHNNVGDFVPTEENFDLDAKHPTTYCQHYDEDTDACGFGCEVLQTSASEHSTSPNFGYATVPEVPSWSPIEGFPNSILADALGDGEQLATKEPLNLDGVLSNEMTLPGDGAMCSSSDLKVQMSCDNGSGATANAEEYLIELSNSLLNCSTEDELLFDGSDMIDKSYIENLSSLLLNFPDENDKPNIGVSETPGASDKDNDCETNSAGLNGESSAKGLYGRVDHHVVGSLETQKLSSALKVNPACPEMRNGVICCVLNTEDTEIPNNDDVFLPFRMPSVSSCAMGDAELDILHSPLTSPVNMFPCSSKVTNGPIIKVEQKNGDISSRLTIPSRPKVFSGTQMINHAKCEEPTNEGPTFPIKESMVVNEQLKILDHDSHDPLIPTRGEVSDSHLRFQKSGPGSNWELSTSATQKHEILHAEHQRIENKTPELITDYPVSDEEEFSCESDGDVPYCSDVEAMILDMDLIPDDQDSYSSQRVSSYQNEEAKRIIMRLEQAAESYMQRIMSAHGAIALLHGRYSKHFIKKTEVLLGRATQDVNVDINLGREAHGNKISRRQAIIKMDNDGSFHLRNYGRQSIYVNGKEVVHGEDVTLVSGSLLEIRGTSFIFETNRAYVKHQSSNLLKES